MTRQPFVFLEVDELSMKIPVAEKVVYFAIKSFCANGTADKDLSSREIADRCGIDFSTVSRAIPNLIKRQLLEIVGRKNRVGGSVNIFRIKSCNVQRLQDNKVLQDETLTPQESVASSKESVASSKESVAELGTKTQQYKREKRKEEKKLFINRHSTVQGIHTKVAPKIKEKSFKIIDGTYVDIKTKLPMEYADDIFASWNANRKDTK